MKLKILTEYILYASLATGMALWVRDHNMPPAGSAPQRRTPAEAAELRAALKIPEGVPTVIEFFDFQCPPCRMTYPGIKTVLARHPNVLYRPVNFPLTMLHPYAFGAAVASSEIAGGDGRTVDDLFTGKTDLDQSSLNAYLKRRGFPGIIGTAAANPYEVRVKADVALGRQMRIEGTPTTFVLSAKGELVQVHGASQLESAL